MENSTVCGKKTMRISHARQIARVIPNAKKSHFWLKIAIFWHSEPFMFLNAKKSHFKTPGDFRALEIENTVIFGPIWPFFGRFPHIFWVGPISIQVPHYLAHFFIQETNFLLKVFHL